MESFRKNITLLKSNTDNQAAITHLHRSAHSAEIQPAGPLKDPACAMPGREPDGGEFPVVSR